MRDVNFFRLVHELRIGNQSKEVKIIPMCGHPISSPRMQSTLPAPIMPKIATKNSIKPKLEHQYIQML